MQYILFLRCTRKGMLSMFFDPTCVCIMLHFLPVGSNAMESRPRYQLSQPPSIMTFCRHSFQRKPHLSEIVLVADACECCFSKLVMLPRDAKGKGRKGEKRVQETERQTQGPEPTQQHRPTQNSHSRGGKSRDGSQTNRDREKQPHTAQSRRSKATRTDTKRKPVPAAQDCQTIRTKERAPHPGTLWVLVPGFAGIRIHRALAAWGQLAH
jgi:hypothetical protein